MNGLLADARYGLRMLIKNPGFTSVAVLSLALGIGANTAIFSLIDAAMLKTLPVFEPERLVILGPGESRGITISEEPEVAAFSYPRFQMLRNDSRTLESLAAVSTRDSTVYLRSRAGEAPRPAQARQVSGEYFPLFGVAPARGRLLALEDNETPGGDAVCVLAHAFWRDRFNSEESIVGSDIVLNDRAYTVIGVASPHFRGERIGDAPDLWTPLSMQAHVMLDESFLERRDVSFLNLIGRLKDGVAQEEAGAELAAIWARGLEAEVGQVTPQYRKAIDREAMTIRPGSRGFNSLDHFSNPLWLLFGVTGLVLLIACSNVANLLLARAATRAREIGVRQALGAGRWRIIRQMLTESLLLAGAGMALGFLVAGWSRDLLVSMATDEPTRWGLDPRLDWRVAAFAAVTAVLTGILFGLVPALRSSRSTAGRLGSRAAIEGGRLGYQRMLVAGQIGLSLVVLFGAGLFLRNLDAMMRADMGFETESLLAVSLDPRGGGDEGERRVRLFDRLIDRVEALPGVVSAAAAFRPLVQQRIFGMSVTIEGLDAASGEEPAANIFPVSPGYFETVGTSILEGRPFDATDRIGAPPRAIVDEGFAKRYFPGESPVGRRVQYSDEVGMVEIIGVARQAKHYGLQGGDGPLIYFPVHALPEFFSALHVRAAGDPAGLASSVRAAIEAEAPDLPIGYIATVEQRMSDDMRNERLISRLTGAFGALAVLLAAIGLYGVMSYRVVRRTNEIGMRMAVGAQARDVLWLVLRDGLTLMAAGLALGLLASFAAGLAVASLLYSGSAWDAAALLAAAGVLLAAGLAASLAPSYRASRLNPMDALRSV